jgi:hypothetical protein
MGQSWNNVSRVISRTLSLSQWHLRMWNDIYQYYVLTEPQLVRHSLYDIELPSIKSAMANWRPAA